MKKEGDINGGIKGLLTIPIPNSVTLETNNIHSVFHSTWKSSIKFINPPHLPLKQDLVCITPSYRSFHLF